MIPFHPGLHFVIPLIRALISRWVLPHQNPPWGNPEGGTWSPHRAPGSDPDQQCMKWKSDRDQHFPTWNDHLRELLDCLESSDVLLEDIPALVICSICSLQVTFKSEIIGNTSECLSRCRVCSPTVDFNNGNNYTLPCANFCSLAKRNFLQCCFFSSRASFGHS